MDEIFILNINTMDGLFCVLAHDNCTIKAPTSVPVARQNRYDRKLHVGILPPFANLLGTTERLGDGGAKLVFDIPTEHSYTFCQDAVFGSFRNFKPCSRSFLTAHKLALLIVPREHDPYLCFGIVYAGPDIS
jgi:hypothetical protein